jgi:DNA-binding GntR family transcriptional regulator
VRRTAQRYGRQEFARSLAEHSALVEAFHARDARWAESTMIGHIRRAFHVFAARTGAQPSFAIEGLAQKP